jgi:hypothetical protein
LKISGNPDELPKSPLKDRFRRQECDKTKPVEFFSQVLVLRRFYGDGVGVKGPSQGDQIGRIFDQWVIA